MCWWMDGQTCIHEFPVQACRAGARGQESQRGKQPGCEHLLPEHHGRCHQQAGPGGSGCEGHQPSAFPSQVKASVFKVFLTLETAQSKNTLTTDGFATSVRSSCVTGLVLGPLKRVGGRSNAGNFSGCLRALPYGVPPEPSHPGSTAVCLGRSPSPEDDRWDRKGQLAPVLAGLEQSQWPVLLS